MVNKELVKKEYLEWVDKVSDDLEDKTYFTVDEIVDKVTELVLKQVDNVVLDDVTQQSELFKALKIIEHYCDENTHEHEYIWHVANDSIKAFNGG
mgnify:CR=1 FL=1|jgi:hypothetical protein|tara:strand:- start:53 stop:337 length:285 start_codon:yes stop_codon:yes gene_type:complete